MNAQKTAKKLGHATNYGDKAVPEPNQSIAEQKKMCIRDSSYMPQWLGTSRDGKNAMKPEQQTSEFMDGLSAPLQKVFAAYGVDSYVDMLGSVKEEEGPWVPMYSYSGSMTVSYTHLDVYKRQLHIFSNFLKKRNTGKQAASI